MAESFTKKKKLFTKEKKSDVDTVVESESENKKEFTVGDIVKHQIFGDGVINVIKGEFILGSFGGSLRTIPKKDLEVL